MYFRNILINGLREISQQKIAINESVKEPFLTGNYKKYLKVYIESKAKILNRDEFIKLDDIYDSLLDFVKHVMDGMNTSCDISDYDNDYFDKKVQIVVSKMFNSWNDPKEISEHESKAVIVYFRDMEIIEDILIDIKGNENLKPDYTLDLLRLLKKDSNWNYLKKQLASKQFVEINSGIAIPEQKGNIGYFIAFIKSLYPKGYLTKKPTNKEITIILKNSFGIETTENTCRQKKGSDFDTSKIKAFDYIKPSID